MRIHGLIRTGLAAFAVVVGGLLFGAPAVFAAAPETPETLAATGVTDSEATLHGVLDPGAEGEPGSYQFSYEGLRVITPGSSPSAAECTAGTLAPGEPVADAGEQGEAETLTVKGLEPNREYAFCIVAYSLAGGLAEPAFGAAIPFTTLPEAPVVDSETASVNSTGATLEAQVNPENQETTFSFEYATQETAGALAGTVVELPGEYPLGVGFGDQTATVPRVEGLTPGKTYYYRVVTKNTGGEEKQGPIEHFTTVPVPHTDAATGVTATTAMLHGHLTLDSEATMFSFEYNDNGECFNGPITTAEEAKGGAVSVEATGLQPGATYMVCMVASNPFGSEVDNPSPPVTFTTPSTAPTVGAEGTSAVTPFEGTLEAQVNPNGLETTYSFEYSTEEELGKLKGAITTLNGAGTLTGGGDQAVSAPTGHVLSSGTTYHFRVVAKNALGEVEGAGEFTTEVAVKPSVDGESFPFLSGKSTTLEAQVNPNYQTTTYSFEYAAGAAGKQLVEEEKGIPVPGGSIPAGSGDRPANVRLSEVLTPGTTYYYRVLATNETGTTPGPVEEFTTPVPPAVSTGVAEEVTSSTAKVSGIVNPQGKETYYTIQYGTTTSYGPSTTPVDAGAGEEEVPVGPVSLGELAPGTTYHYRVLATNSAGESTAGADEQFTTAPAPPVPPKTEPAPPPAPASAAAGLPAASAFPNLTGIVPLPAGKEPAVAGSGVKSLTRAQKLAKALKACRAKPRGKRVACERAARKRYAPAKHNVKKKK